MNPLLLLTVYPKSSTIRTSREPFGCVLILFLLCRAMLPLCLFPGITSAFCGRGSVPIVASFQPRKMSSLHPFMTNCNIVTGLENHMAIQVIWKPICVSFVFTSQFQTSAWKAFLWSFSYFKCNYTAGLNLFWQKLSVCMCWKRCVFIQSTITYAFWKSLSRKTQWKVDI